MAIDSGYVTFQLQALEEIASQLAAVVPSEHVEIVERMRVRLANIASELKQEDSCSHDQTLGELSGSFESGTEQTCSQCGASVIRW